MEFNFLKYGLLMQLAIRISIACGVISAVLLLLMGCVKKAPQNPDVKFYIKDCTENGGNVDLTNNYVMCYYE